MRRVVYDQEDRCLQWASDRIGTRPFSEFAHAIGVINGDEILAVTVWDNFSSYNCTMSIASDGGKRWMSREFLFRSFAYPFIQLDLRRATVVVAEGNDESLRLGLHLGFTVECERVRRFFGDKDAIMMGMLREECRWIGDGFAKAAA